MQAGLPQQAREAALAAMLIVKVIAETTAAQCTRRSSSGEALDVRWAKAQATLAPPGRPAGVAEHLASRLGVCTQAFTPLTYLCEKRKMPSGLWNMGLVGQQQYWLP